jgi:hypothetical protein
MFAPKRLSNLTVRIRSLFSLHVNDGTGVNGDAKRITSLVGNIVFSRLLAYCCIYRGALDYRHEHGGVVSVSVSEPRLKQQPRISFIPVI